MDFLAQNVLKFIIYCQSPSSNFWFYLIRKKVAKQKKQTMINEH
jgi:hypothetical protein